MQRSLTPAVLTALIALYLIWGSTYFAMRLVVEGMPPLLSAGIRYTIAGGLMFLFLKWRGAAWPTAVQWRDAGIVGVLLLLGGNGAVALALDQGVSSGMSALVVAIAPLIIIWVKDPTASLVVCATLVALFPIISNTTVGLRSVNPGLAAYFQLQRATRWQTLVRLRIPSALPYFFAGLRISGGLALIGAVVAEFVAGTGGTGTGLAYQILQAGYQLNIPRLFAALVLISVTGVAVFAFLSALSRWALSGWHESEMNP